MEARIHSLKTADESSLAESQRLLEQLGKEFETSKQVILPTASGVSNEGGSSPLLAPCRLFLGPGLRLGARWNRLVETVKTRKKRGKTGGKWARYGLRSVKDGS